MQSISQSMDKMKKRRRRKNMEAKEWTTTFRDQNPKERKNKREKNFEVYIIKLNGV